jgi:hypothetical protein
MSRTPPSPECSWLKLSTTITGGFNSAAIRIASQYRSGENGGVRSAWRKSKSSA